MKKLLSLVLALCMLCMAATALAYTAGEYTAAAMTGVGEGPYCAVRVRPATIGTMGGIKVDLDMHVLKADGSIIPGLYAAGACANGDFFYKEYPASGTSIMMCFTVGRIAGENAAQCD